MVAMNCRRSAFAPLVLLVVLTAAAQSPDLQCAGCHKKIYDIYQATPMARASGAAADGLLPGEFTHVPSGVHYRLLLRDGRAWLRYDRPGGILKGEQELAYFIGSGQRGRTYLFQRDGFWFESPVNWYSKQHVWDMNPKSLDAREMPLTLKVDAGCLHCHASGVQKPAGANNHFGPRPFLYGGVTCQSCHGDATAHLASGGTAPILNPAKLAPASRDSICLQCHLEGEIAVHAPGRTLADFYPGQVLSDYVSHFVQSGEMGPEGRATSQWEALLQSECKKKSGDRLTCTTCHDPHDAPATEQRVSYFRSKCLTCHGEPSFLAKHHPDQPSCSGCHMPREKSTDVAHEQLTDHRIQRYLSQRAPEGSLALTLIGGGKPSDRDLGLAYFQFAKHGNQQAGQKAMSLLQRAEREGNTQADSDLHGALGLMAHLSGNPRDARLEYQAALKANPQDSVAAADLAVLDARTGDVKSAIGLLEGVSQLDPGESTASMDLAMIQCAVGNAPAAAMALHRLLEFSPDDRKARQMLDRIESRVSTGCSN